MYQPLLYPPGVSRKNTEAQSAGRYWDANLIRWYGDELGPVLGWVVRGTDTFEGMGRAILAWEANNGAKRIAIGTHSGLYAQATTQNIFDITPVGFVAGNASSGSQTGFGGGAFGSGAFGTARPDTGVTSEATVWDLDTYGQDMVGVSPDDGTPYVWQRDVTVKAIPIPNAPTQCSGLVVTAQRSVMVCGAGGDGRNIAWSDLEDYTDWTPTSENQAGDFDITTKGKILKLLRINNQVLVLTSVDAWLASYDGSLFVYGFSPVGHGCGVLSKGAAVPMGQQAVWWSDSGFWQFDGTACQAIPCDLEDVIKTGVNLGQIAKISGFHNTEYGEVTWYFPSVNATENDSYITWSYRGGWWTKGTLARLASCEKGPFRWPMALGADGHVYDHDRSFNYDGAVPFAQTAPTKLGAGDMVMLVNGVIGDEKTVGDVTIGFAVKDFPNATEFTVDPVPLTSRGYSDLRFAGRQAKMTISCSTSGDWRFGAAELDLEQGGRR